MGIYNRDYIREDRPGVYGGLSGNEWAIKYLLIANAVVFMLQSTPLEGPISDWLSLSLNDLRTGQIWRLVTYSFCHGSPAHIIFNMLGLWIFGRHVQPIHGSKEFLAFYFGGVVVSGLSHVVLQAINQTTPGVIGASGGVMAVVCLTAATFPRMKFFFSIELWVLAVVYVLLDLRALLRPDGSGVAHVAHLGGAAFGVAYKYYDWRLSPIWENATGWVTDFRRRRRNPNVRIFKPTSEPMSDRVDTILEKIHKQGEASLTDEEREVLKEASRRLNQR